MVSSTSTTRSGVVPGAKPAAIQRYCIDERYWAEISERVLQPQTTGTNGMIMSHGAAYSTNIYELLKTVVNDVCKDATVFRDARSFTSFHNTERGTGVTRRKQLVAQYWCTATAVANWFREKVMALNCLYRTHCLHNIVPRAWARILFSTLATWNILKIVTELIWQWRHGAAVSAPK